MVNTKKFNLHLNYDLLLPIFLLTLLSSGVQYWIAVNEGKDGTVPALKQLFFIFVGYAGMFLASRLSQKFIWKVAPFFYGFSLILMSALYFSYDKGMYLLTGTKRWLDLGFIKFQPSEIAKIAFILMLAKIIVQHEQQDWSDKWRSDKQLLKKIVAVSVPVFFLMAVQKDFGTSLVFVTIILSLLVISGIDRKILIIIFSALATLGVVLILLVFTEWGHKVLFFLHFKQYQLDRILAWIHPYDYVDKISYQQVQGLLAIGSGGLFGKGVHGIEVYVPVRESDMIFTVVGENFGFIGGCFIILLYFILIYRMIRVCFDTNNEFYAYIATGIIMMILFHVFENIGANIGLLPLTGIPLPFISQGGSSILGNMIGVGLIMSMRYQQETVRTRSGR